MASGLIAEITHRAVEPAISPRARKLPDQDAPPAPKAPEDRPPGARILTTFRTVAAPYFEEIRLPNGSERK